MGKEPYDRSKMASPTDEKKLGAITNFDKSDKFRVESHKYHVPSESSEDDLTSIIASRNQEKTRKISRRETIGNEELIGNKSRKRRKKSSSRKKGISSQVQVADEISGNADQSGKTLMELLELEMRARAIKRLLLNSKEEEKTTIRAHDSEEKNLTKNAIPSNENEDKINEAIEQKEKEKQLQKAREQLHISQAKKKEEEYLIEKRNEEIRKAYEEAEKIKDAEEAERKR